MMLLPERFWSKVNIGTPRECWGWLGHIDSRGYGHFWLRGRLTLSHRVAYEITHGPIENGFVIDHVCHNKSCANPGHLRKCTGAENIRNAGMSKNNTSGFKGVSYCNRSGKWKAAICRDRRIKFLGRFATPQEAYAAYCEAAPRLHGDFHNLGVAHV